MIFMAKMSWSGMSNALHKAGVSENKACQANSWARASESLIVKLAMDALSRYLVRVGRSRWDTLCSRQCFLAVNCSTITVTARLVEISDLSPSGG